MNHQFATSYAAGCIGVHFRAAGIRVLIERNSTARAVRPDARQPLKRKGRPKRKTAKINPHGPHVPLPGQLRLFGDDELAAAHHEPTDDTAIEDK